MVYEVQLLSLARSVGVRRPRRSRWSDDCGAAIVEFALIAPMLFALLLGGVHVVFIGYEGWLKPAGWHGGLPPISLVAFAFFAVGYLINLFGRE